MTSPKNYVTMGVVKEGTTNMELSTERQAAALRRELRMLMPPDEDHQHEWYFAPLCPDDKHGKASGATYWFCQCAPCREYSRRISAKGRINNKFNRGIILATQTPVSASPTGEPPGGDRIAPGPGSQDDVTVQADPSGRVPTRGTPGHTATAPPVADVESNPAPTPGPTTPEEYIAQLRADMARRGLTA